MQWDYAQCTAELVSNSKDGCNSPKAHDRFNQVVEVKRFEGVFLCSKVC